jgi:hypothetical protein
MLTISIVTNKNLKKGNYMYIMYYWNKNKLRKRIATVVPFLESMYIILFIFKKFFLYKQGAYFNYIVVWINNDLHVKIYCACIIPVYRWKDYRYF